MKAQVLYGIDNLKYAEVDIPAPKAGEALIELSCCGICGSDVPRIFKTGAHNMPLIPGHEMTGRVKECADRPELVGKRVGIFPLIPCKECPQCKAGHYEMCENYNYLGSRCDGGFAEYVTAPVWNLLPIPEEVSDEDAAMLEPMSVAVHAIRNVGLIEGGLGDKSAPEKTQKENISIVVCGLGTIGLLTALFLKDAGYTKVYCIGNKDIQKKKLLEMGYKEEQFFDVRYGDPVAFIKKTTGAGADYYFECIGRPESYEQAIKCTAPLGRVMLVGNPASDMDLTRETYWKILRNQMSLTGTWNSAFSGIDGDESDKNAMDDWRYVISRLEDFAKEKSAFHPGNLVTHSFSIADMPKGLDIMHRKSEDYIKIMIKY
ncbi:galactitol-1-phosphate 5-dehydrogenase [Butyrivibrio sp. CB08]|uniref:galactitol-1-phosphate 5-dehydrogenase n=1 Tax=Butyrivibrio sp. CB08 TaxID=2364879 RepID=UPI000EA8B298|nr:galactitol-1-phosphate 5-dehydrogenase [Butyrivibrio sp. CB08]RKM59773.1 galactitol-1-phosphate 5-dehydrogenase [Butyrivibrio sp. CB08]